MKFCTNCGTKLHDEARFCSSCGKKQLIADEPCAYACEAEQKIPTELIFKDNNEQNKQEINNQRQDGEIIIKKRFPVISIIRNSIILLIATLLLTFSFLPVISISEEYMGVEVEVNLSPIDNIVLMFDSFQSVDESDSEIYEEIKDVTSDIYSAGNNQEKAEKLASKLVYLYLRYSCQSKDFIIYPSLIFSAIFSFIYIIACIGFFVVALLNLLATVGVIKKAKRALHNWTVSLLCAMPCLFLALYYIMYAIYGGSAANVSFSVLSIISFTLIALTIVMTFIFRLIFSEQKVKLKLPARIVATCLSIIVIGLAFAPVISFDVTMDFAGSDTTKTVSNTLDLCVFTALELDSDTLEQVEDIKDYSTTAKTNYFTQLAEYYYSALSKNDAKGPMGAAVGASVLSFIFATKTTEALTAFISQSYIFFLIAIIGALMVLWQNLVYFTLGKEFNKTALTGKLLSGIAAIFALTLSIIYVVLISDMLQLYIPSLMSVYISAGVIIFAIFAVGSIFCPIGKEKKAIENNIVTEIKEEF